MPGPQLLLAAGLAWAVSVGGALYLGYGLGQDGELARQAREAEVVAKVSEAAALGAASEIARIEVERQTIVQPVERVIREKTVYRDCRHDPVVLRGLNQALTGETAGSGQLPALDAPRRR